MSFASCRDRAFTLIELLASLSIFIILIALTISGIDRMIKNAWAVQSSGNLRQLVAANAAYAADNEYYAPVANRDNTIRWCAAMGSNGKFDPTKGYLSDYLGKSRRVTACPLFTHMIKGENSFELGTGGYGYNDNYVGGRPEGQAGGRAAWNADGSRISATPVQIGKPAQTVMFTTSAYANGDSVQEYPYSHPPYWDFGGGPNAWGLRPSPSTHFRFRGKALVGWCDGHVSAEKCDPRDVGYNPHGGDAAEQLLGWFGPDRDNGYWNPGREYDRE